MSEQEHVDRATLDMLQDVLEGGFTGLVDTFVEDAEQRIASMRAGLATGDADLVRRSAHSLKGSGSNIGARRLAELCQTVESQARAGELAGLEELLENIEANYSEVRQVLERRRGD